MKNLKKMLVLSIVVLLVTASAQAAGVFIEDFSGLVNSTGGTYPGTLSNAGGGTGADTDGWVIRNPQAYEAENGAFSTTDRVNYIGGQRAGKAHGVDMNGTTSIEMEFTAIGASYDHFQIWLSDENQNGYGIYTDYMYLDDGLGRQWSGCDMPFGGSYNGTRSGDGTGELVVANWGYDVTFNIKLEQAAPGGNITFTLWSSWVDGNGAQSGGPVVLTDSGLGTGDFSEAGIQDISTLTHIAIGSQASVPVTALMVDDIVVTVVPEPATLVMLGLGGVGVLIRRRRRA